MRQAARQASPRQAGPATAISGPAAVDGFIPFALRCARGPRRKGRTGGRRSGGPLSSARAGAWHATGRRMKMSSRGRFNLAHPPKRASVAFELPIWQTSASFVSPRTYRAPTQIFKPAPLVNRKVNRLLARTRTFYGRTRHVHRRPFLVPSTTITLHGMAWTKSGTFI